MRSTKVLLMIVCGMGLSNINAEIIQGITKPENPEILIVNKLSLKSKHVFFSELV